MNKHIDTTRRHLGELAAMSDKTEAAERKILARAEGMLAKVEADIEKVRPTAMVDGADRYQELIAERGRLHQVIAQAKAVLA